MGKAGCCRSLSMAPIWETRAVLCPSWLMPHSFHGVLCTILSGNKLSVSENQKRASMFVLKLLHTSAENIIYKLCIYLFDLFMHVSHSPWLSPSALMGKRGKCAATSCLWVLGEPKQGLSIIIKVCRQWGRWLWFTLNYNNFLDALQPCICMVWFDLL